MNGQIDGLSNSQVTGRQWSKTMNIMNIGGYQAVVAFDPDIKMFRGEFVGLNGGTDFYAADAEGLEREGKISLQIFLDMRKEDGISPMRAFSGKFNVRLSPELHAAAAAAAKASGKNLNQWIAGAVRKSCRRQ
jgi:predicted HicB family RNase H-like nuclease